MIGFPLLLIPFAIYNIFVFLMPGVAFTSPIVSVTLMSGVVWTVTFSDALLALALLLLLLEVIKAARPAARYLTDHLLSLVVFGAALAEFLLLAPFATSTFFLLTVLTGVEFLAGVSIGFRGRRRKRADAVVPAPVPAAREPDLVPVPPAPEPAVERAEPVPAPVLTHVEPSFAPSAHDTIARDSAARADEADFVEKPDQRPIPASAATHPTEASEHGTAPSAAPTLAPGRKITEWNAGDVISGAEPEIRPGAPLKP